MADWQPVISLPTGSGVGCGASNGRGVLRARTAGGGTELRKCGPSKSFQFPVRRRLEAGEEKDPGSETNG